MTFFCSATVFRKSNKFSREEWGGASSVMINRSGCWEVGVGNVRIISVPLDLMGERESEVRTVEIRDHVEDGIDEFEQERTDDF
mmetsp:Transcript_33505/g.81292  ORF Transcript_33505/g.81292 Transcript_33505/m.81292 type:complete len:84 (+) Transcript_33505:1213-1464(+)